MKKRLIKNAVATLALAAMLTQNMYSAVAVMAADFSNTSEEYVEETEEGAYEEEPVSEQPDISIEPEYNEESNEEYIEEENSDDFDNEADADVLTEDEAAPILEEEPVVEQLPESLDILSNQISGSGLDSISVIVNTDELKTGDKFRIVFTGAENAQYDTRINDDLDSSSAGTYTFDNLNKDGFNIRATSYDDVVFEYASNGDTPIIKAISISNNSDKLLKIKPITLNDGKPSEALAGEGFENVTVDLDTEELADGSQYIIYVETQANALVNGESVSKINAGKDLEKLEISDLDGEEFSVYVMADEGFDISSFITVKDSIEGIAKIDICGKEIREKKVYTFEDSQVFVRAELQRVDAVPDNAEIVVTPITDGEQYEAYMKALNDNVDEINENSESKISEITENNVLLYDIAFVVDKVDENGEVVIGDDGKPVKVEYQPDDGSVTVSIQFKKAQLSEDLGAVDGSDVTVVHLPIDENVKEEENSLTVETDITSNDVSIEVMEDKTSVGRAETVEFTADTFSAYAVITQDKGRYYFNPEDYKVDEVNYLDVLGSAVNYGIVANTINLPQVHLDSNFATKKMVHEGGNQNITLGKYSGNPGNIIIASSEGSGFYPESAEVTENSGSYKPYIVYTTEAVKNSLFNLGSTKGAQFNTTKSQEVLEGWVDSLLTGTKSSELYTTATSADKAFDSDSEVDEGKETKTIGWLEAIKEKNSKKYSLDISKHSQGTQQANQNAEPAGGTYYFNFDSVEQFNDTFGAATDGFEIHLKANQNIVFTIKGEGTVNVKKFSVKIDGLNSNYNNGFIRPDDYGTIDLDPYTKSVIFNMPDATGLEFTDGGGMGVFLAPKAAVDVKSTSHGWIVCNTFTNSSAEWHGVWAEMPESTEVPRKSFTFNISKEIEDGKAWPVDENGEPLSFTFKIKRLNGFGRKNGYTWDDRDYYGDDNIGMGIPADPQIAGVPLPDGKNVSWINKDQYNAEGSITLNESNRSGSFGSVWFSFDNSGTGAGNDYWRCGFDQVGGANVDHTQSKTNTCVMYKIYEELPEIPGYIPGTIMHIGDDFLNNPNIEVIESTTYEVHPDYASFQNSDPNVITKLRIGNRIYDTRIFFIKLIVSSVTLEDTGLQDVYIEQKWSNTLTTCGGIMHGITFENGSIEEQGGLTVDKKVFKRNENTGADDDVTESTDESFFFGLWKKDKDSNGNNVEDRYSDKEGRSTFELNKQNNYSYTIGNLNKGNYIVKETDKDGNPVNLSTYNYVVMSGESVQNGFNADIKASKNNTTNITIKNVKVPIKISGTKKVEPAGAEMDSFKFEIKDVSGNGLTAPMPEANKVTNGDYAGRYVTNNISGAANFEFDSIYYTAKDAGKTYQYEISEVDPGGGKYEYSTEKYIVTVVVSDNVHVTKSIDKVVFNTLGNQTGTESASSIEFTNILKGGKPLEFNVTKAQISKGSFDFELTAKGDAPLPAIAADTTTVGTVTVDQTNKKVKITGVTPNANNPITATFGTVNLAQGDLNKTYEYEIKEIPPTGATQINGKYMLNDIIYDPTVYNISATLRYRDGQFVIDTEKIPETGATFDDTSATAYFNVNYTNIKVAEGKGQFPVAKIVKNSELNSKEFKFYLYEAKNDKYAITDDMTPIRVVKVTGSGIACFSTDENDTNNGPITYAKTGTHYYVYREDVPAGNKVRVNLDEGKAVPAEDGKYWLLNGVLYQAEDVKFKVTVSASDEKQFSIAITDVNGDPIKLGKSVGTFTNDYITTECQGEIPVTKSFNKVLDANHIFTFNAEYNGYKALTSDMTTDLNGFDKGAEEADATPSPAELSTTASATEKSQTLTFNNIVFKQKGFYKYTVTEQTVAPAPDENGSILVYDENKFIVVFTIVDNNGTLEEKENSRKYYKLPKTDDKSELKGPNATEVKFINTEYDEAEFGIEAKKIITGMGNAPFEGSDYAFGLFSQKVENPSVNSAELLATRDATPRNYVAYNNKNGDIKFDGAADNNYSGPKLIYDYAYMQTIKKDNNIEGKEWSYSFKYYMHEIVPEDKSNLNTDKKTVYDFSNKWYEITVPVSVNENTGAITVNRDKVAYIDLDTNNSASLEFENKYYAYGELKLGVDKVLSGTTKKEQQFRFLLIDENDGTNKGNTITTTTVDVKGSGSETGLFDIVNELIYNQDDVGKTFYYGIKEDTEYNGKKEAPNDGSIIPDNVTYHIKVEVAHDEVRKGQGFLNATASLINVTNANGNVVKGRKIKCENNVYYFQFNNLKYEEGVVDLHAFKTLNNKILKKDEFTFKLFEITADGYVPKETVTNGGVNNNSVDFTKVRALTEADLGQTYKYKIVEEDKGDERYKIELGTIYAEVTVPANIGAGEKIVPTVEYYKYYDATNGTFTDEITSAPAFVNTFNDSISVPFMAAKKLYTKLSYDKDGKPVYKRKDQRKLSSEDIFSFELWTPSGTAPIQTVYNTDDGTENGHVQEKINFNSIDFITPDMEEDYIAKTENIGKKKDVDYFVLPESATDSDDTLLGTKYRDYVYKFIVKESPVNKTGYIGDTVEYKEVVTIRVYEDATMKYSKQIYAQGSIEEKNAGFLGWVVKGYDRLTGNADGIVFRNVYKAESRLKLPVKKTLLNTTSNWSYEPSFTFKLYDGKDVIGSVTVEKDEVNYVTFKDDAGNDVDYITYKAEDLKQNIEIDGKQVKQGTFEYTLKEDNEGLTGINYSDPEHAIKVVVTDKGTGTLDMECWIGGEKVELTPVDVSDEADSTEDSTQYAAGDLDTTVSGELQAYKLAEAVESTTILAMNEYLPVPAYVSFNANKFLTGGDLTAYLTENKDVAFDFKLTAGKAYKLDENGAKVEITGKTSPLSKANLEESTDSATGQAVKIVTNLLGGSDDAAAADIETLLTIKYDEKTEPHVASSVAFDPILYTFADLKDGDTYLPEIYFTYQLFESNADGTQDGLISTDSTDDLADGTLQYDLHRADITVKVTDNGDGTLSAVAYKNSAPTTSSTNTLTENYTNNIVHKGMTTIEATKTVDNASIYNTSAVFDITLSGEAKYTGTAHAKPAVELTKQIAVNTTGSGQVTFGSEDFEGGNLFKYDIKDFSESGKYDYVYTITETRKSEVLDGVTVLDNPEYTYDTKVYTATITVDVDKATGKFDISGPVYTYPGMPADEKPGAAHFTNTYEANGSFDIPVAKTLNGRDIIGDEFTFELYDNNGNMLPLHTTGALADEDGKAVEELVFSHDKNNDGKAGYAYVEKFNYTRADMDGKAQTTKYYALLENHPTDEKGKTVESYNGVSYDPKVYVIKVDLTDDGMGNISTVPTVKYGFYDVTKDGAENARDAIGIFNNLTAYEYANENKINFVNNYTAKGEIVLSASKRLLGRDLTTDDELTFGVYEKLGDNDAMVRDGVKYEKSLTNINGSYGQVVFEKINYTLADMADAEVVNVTNGSADARHNNADKYTKKTITYYLHESTPTPTVTKKVTDEQGNEIEVPVYTYDNTEYYPVTVTIIDDGCGVLHTSKDLQDSEPITFINQYDPVGSIDFYGIKTMEGRDFEDESGADIYRFSLIELDSTGKAISDTYYVENEKSSNDKGLISFLAKNIPVLNYQVITVVKDATTGETKIVRDDRKDHYYLIAEEPVSDTSIEIGGEKYIVTVNVDDAKDEKGKLIDGELSAKVTKVEKLEKVGESEIRSTALSEDELANIKTDIANVNNGIVEFTNKYKASAKIVISGKKHLKEHINLDAEITDMSAFDRPYTFAIYEFDDEASRERANRQGNGKLKGTTSTAIGDSNFAFDLSNVDDILSYNTLKQDEFKNNPKEIVKYLRILEVYPVDGIEKGWVDGYYTVDGVAYDSKWVDLNIIVTPDYKSDVLGVKVVNASTGTELKAAVSGDQYSYDLETEYKFTNIKPTYTKIRARKYWDGATTGPDVTVDLYAKTGSNEEKATGQYAVLTASNKYEHTFEKLDVCDKDGNTIEYSIKERPVPGYYLTGTNVTKDPDGTIVYELTNAKGDIFISKYEAGTTRQLPGATLAIYSLDGSEIERWVSGTTAHKIAAKLETGATYILRELAAPTGYDPAPEKRITIRPDVSENNPQEEYLEDPKIVGNVLLRKMDSETRELLSGAEFALYREDGTRVYASGTAGVYSYSEVSSNGRLVVNERGELSVRNLPYGTYYFEEVSAPAGYALNTERLSFSILETDATVEVSFLDPKILGSVTLRKTNVAGTRSLAGAVFELYVKTPTSISGAIASTIYGDVYYRVGSYTTNSEGYIEVGDLPWDDYYFIEVQAPDGYQINTDTNGDPIVYTFTIDGSTRAGLRYDLGRITNETTPPDIPPTTPSTPPTTTDTGRRLGGVLSGVLGVRAAPESGVLGERVGPVTGDAANIILWLLLLIACVGTIVAMVIKSNKRGRKNIRPRTARS